MPRITVRFKWEWRDLWVGAFIDDKKRVLYICPLPTCVIRIGFWENYVAQGN